MRKNAVIFDMDGVVSDTQKFHAEVESLILRQHGIEMSPEAITKRYSGVADDVMFMEIFEEHAVNSHPPIDEIVVDKWNKMATVAKGRITAIPHVVDLIRILKKEGFRLAIASASTTIFIQEVLDELDLNEFFDTTVSAQEVKHGKPAPDIFLLAAERLGVEPEACIVIEDGRSGMIGAKAAGIPCIGLVEDTSEEYPATVVVRSLDQITPDLIHSL